jgi:hypothetical protein
MIGLLVASSPVPDTFPLTEADVAHYAEHGFLAVERLTSAAEVESLQAVYDWLFADAAVAEGDRIALSGDRLPQILNPDHYAPELRETEAWHTAGEIARRLLGPDAVPTGMHAIRKTPGLGVETPWHQDEAYWDPARAHHALSVWMPLQPATRENGCMEFQPGSHRLPVLEHRLIDAGSEGLELVDPATVTDPVACPLPAGGATFHDARTLHYTGPNLSDAPRRALIFSFACPSEPLDEPRDFRWQRSDAPPCPTTPAPSTEGSPR